VSPSDRDRFDFLRTAQLVRIVLLPSSWPFMALIAFSAS